MPGLFGQQAATDAVPAVEVLNLTGVSEQDFQLPGGVTLSQLIDRWTTGVASNIHVRLGRQVAQGDADYAGICDVLRRTVAIVVSVAQQQRSAPVIDASDQDVPTVSTVAVTQNLDAELAPFIRWGEAGDGAAGRWGVDIFSSIAPEDESGGGTGGA